MSTSSDGATAAGLSAASFVYSSGSSRCNAARSSLSTAGSRSCRAAQVSEVRR